MATGLYAASYRCRLILLIWLSLSSATAQTWQGSLDAHSPRFSSGDAYAEHALQVAAGERVLLELHSSAFQPFLLVALPDGGYLQPQRLSDDASLWLELNPDQSGTWTAIVTSPRGSHGLGEYRLQVTRGEDAIAEQLRSQRSNTAPDDASSNIQNNIQGDIQDSSRQPAAEIAEPRRAPRLLTSLRSTAATPANTAPLSPPWQHRPQLSQPIQQRLEAHSSSVHSVAFSAQANVLASGGAELILWRDGLPIAVHTTHQARISQLSFSPDGQLLASAATDGSLILWQLQQGGSLQPRQRLSIGDADIGVEALVFSPDGRYVVAGGLNSSTHIWDVATGSLLQRLEENSSALAFSPDGSLLASALPGQAVLVREVGSGQTRHMLLGHPRDVRSLQFSPDGDSLVALSWGGQLSLWQLEPSHLQRRWGDDIEAVRFHPQESLLLTGHDDGSVVLWNTASGLALQRIQNHTARINALAVGADNHVASAGQDGNAQIFQLSLEPQRITAIQRDASKRRIEVRYADGNSLHVPYFYQSRPAQYRFFSQFRGCSLATQLGWLSCDGQVLALGLESLEAAVAVLVEEIRPQR